MNLLIDVDGVICKYPFHKLTKQYFGVKILNTEIISYSLEEVLGVPTEDVSRMFSEACWLPAQFINRSVETLERLYEAGHGITIYSNRIHFMSEGDLYRWLTENKIPFDKILNPAAQTTMFAGKYDFHVDDSVTKLLALRAITSRRLLFDQPWNRNCRNILGLLERVRGWRQVEEKINGGV